MTVCRAQSRLRLLGDLQQLTSRFLNLILKEHRGAMRLAGWQRVNAASILRDAAFGRSSERVTFCIFVDGRFGV
jgi:hypothetical protein